MSQFLLLLYDSLADLEMFQTMPPEEMQKVIEKYHAWTQTLIQQGKYVSSSKLKDEGGRIVTSGQGKAVVVDGPFSETKEVIGGFYLVRAADYAEAVTLAQTCPHLTFGGRIEIREIDAV